MCMHDLLEVDTIFSHSPVILKNDQYLLEGTILCSSYSGSDYTRGSNCHKDSVGKEDCGDGSNVRTSEDRGD